MYIQDIEENYKKTVHIITNMTVNLTMQVKKTLENDIKVQDLANYNKTLNVIEVLFF
jgi:hypothetical protein